MRKFLLVIVAAATLTVVAVPGQAQASWLSQALNAMVNPPGSYYYPPPVYGYPGYNYPPGYGYGYPASPYQYPQAHPYYPNPNFAPQPYGYSTQPYGYGNGTYRSYYNDPQWQHDWREWMRTHPYQ